MRVRGIDAMQVLRPGRGGAMGRVNHRASVRLPVARAQLSVGAVAKPSPINHSRLRSRDRVCSLRSAVHPSSIPLSLRVVSVRRMYVTSYWTDHLLVAFKSQVSVCT